MLVVARAQGYGMNEVTERVASLRGYLAADPGNTQLACDLIDALFAAGDFNGADASIAALPAAVQEAAGIRFRRARCALILGRHAEAAQVLGGLIADGHENVALWHDLAFAQLCMRQLRDAAATIAAAQARFGADAELAVVSARVALMDGDFARANAALDTALALAPEHATALGLRALVLLDSGETDAAMQDALACLARYPDQHEALLVAGTVALWRQDLANAETFYQRALARHPNSGRALSGRGQLLMLRNDLPAAIGQLEHAVVAMPDHIGTWHALAWAQLLQGRLDAAEASYRQAYALDDNFADSHGGLALIDALKGRTQQAELSVKKALRLNPQCVTALYAKTLLLSDGGRAEEADALLSGLMGQINLPPTMNIHDFARNLRSRFQAAPSTSTTSGAATP